MISDKHRWNQTDFLFVHEFASSTLVKMTWCLEAKYPKGPSLECDSASLAEEEDCSVPSSIPTSSIQRQEVSNSLSHPGSTEFDFWGEESEGDKLLQTKLCISLFSSSVVRCYSETYIFYLVKIAESYIIHTFRRSSLLLL